MNHDYQTYKGTWKEDLRLYVHVPFCVKKCAYCDFLSGPSNGKGIESYFNALYKEIRSYKDRTRDYIVTSIYIGGGTPSCVDSDYITRTLNEIKDAFELSIDIEPEITIEVNPGTMYIVDSNNLNSFENGRNKLKEYKKAGINRISFGLQSTHDHELRLLGRIHSYSEFLENFNQARELGFNNINIDLMSALPGQSTWSWEETLIRIAKLNPEHISAYSLIIEEGTPFYDMYGPEGEERDKLPSEETDRLIYAMTKEKLMSQGYKRYEISNYAKEGYECRHNIAYWERVSYLGLGLGSASLIGNTRFSNTNSLKEYMNIINGNHNKFMSTNTKKIYNIGILDDFYGIRRNIISLTKNQQIEEFMFLGLRKSDGVSKSSFLNKFGISMDYIYDKQINKLEKERLIIIEKDFVKLTDYGTDVSNMVLSEFLID
ncbi:MAG: radical SAM family heme chaperone HemW [Herbinix sp.]|nr:radical SAM family heme chaperone HemW [Herbinix sp.]